MATTPLPTRNATTDKSITSIPESQWTDRQRQYAAQYGLHGVGYQPLPTRNATTDKSITSIPESQWTDRQRQYAAQYGLSGLKTTAPVAATPPSAVSAPAASPAQQAIDTSASDAAAAAVKDSNNRDAYASVQDVLGQYGLSSMAGWVWQEIVGGKSQAEVLQELRQQPEFKTRFPAIAAREAKGLPALSPGEYVAYEKQATELFRANGLPQGFYDSTDDFTKFLSADVSMSELNDRVQLGRKAAYESPQDVRDVLARDYGIDGGSLTAYFLDPDRAEPLLAKQFAAGQIGGAAQRTGFGATTRAENEQLASLGVSDAQAQQGFSNLQGNSELFTALDQGEQGIGRTDQLSATFEGNANAQQRIEAKRRKRLAEFQGGGDYITTRPGYTAMGVAGLGSTDS